MALVTGTTCDELGGIFRMLSSRDSERRNESWLGMGRKTRWKPIFEKSGLGR